jgi:hypothetical protein
MPTPRTSSDTGTDWTTVFVAVPTPEGSPAAGEASELTVDAVRRACQHASRDAAEPWTIEVTEGRLAPTDDPTAIRRSIRRKFVEEVDAVVGLLREASYGCGREVGWAVALGIPALLLHRTGTPLSPHAGGTPPEARVDVRDYDSPAQLHDAVYDWLRLRRAQIIAGSIRRSRPLAVTEPVRIATLRAWERARPQERRRVRDALLATEEQIEAVLRNPLDFASTRSALILDLSAQLGVVLPTPISTEDWQRRTALPALPHDARVGLEDAIDTWGWDGAKTLLAVELGWDKLRHDREMQRQGVAQRTGSLASRFAWKRLVDDYARRSGTAR